MGATKVTPIEVTTDKAPVYPAVLDELLPAAWQCTDATPTTGRVRPRPPQGEAAADARAQAGP
jgi:hypothetical protein